MLKKTLIRADNVNTDVSYSLIFQCALTVCQTVWDPQLLNLISDIVKRLLKESSKTDQIYIGLKTLKLICEFDYKYIQEN